MFAESLRPLWSLEPGVLYLNHGSFGACPKEVLDQQARLRAQLEAEPVRFFVRELEPLLDQARAELARLVGARPEDLAFLSNASTGVSTVLRSLQFGAGDQLLCTNHGYNACTNALRFVAERSGAELRTAEVPFPCHDPQQVIDAVLAAVGPRTKLALLDHVTSPTAMVWPIEALVRALAQRGVECLIDGAHAPGMVPLDLAALERAGASYYTANCHKWLCAPKGAAFLWVRGDRQPQIRPLTLSHGANAPRKDRSRYLLEFDWTGTSDPSALLSVPYAIRWMQQRAPDFIGQNHALVLEGRRILARALGVPLPCPDAMIGSMAALPLPEGPAEALHDQLFEGRPRIEVPIVPWPAPPQRLLRISAQLYNSADDYVQLAAQLEKIL